MKQRELAVASGESLGKTTHCINSLLEKGLINFQNFKSSNRKAIYAYLLTPAGIAEKTILAKRFLMRKMKEYELLEAEIQLLKQEVMER
jgi:EPS-associated MarR family transcriptional regulator